MEEEFIIKVDGCNGAPTQFTSRYQWMANSVLLAITFVWGATFTLTKNALSNIDPFSLLSMRFLVAGAVLFIFILASSRIRELIQLQTLFVGVVLGILLFAGYIYQTLGLEDISPSISGFLTGLNVVLVPLLSVPLLRSRLLPRTWFGAFLAMAGLAVMNGTDFRGLFSHGSVETLLCALFVALQIIFVEKWGSRHDALVIATIEVWVVALCCMISSMLKGSLTLLLNFHIWMEPVTLLATVVNGVLGTSFALWGQNAVQKFTSSTQTSIIFSMEPVFAAIIAWVVRGDTMSPQEIAGGLLVFLSMLISDPNIDINRVVPGISFKRERRNDTT
jgi:drug/metabolite transporter (DMT)-like permease